MRKGSHITQPRIMRGKSAIIDLPDTLLDNLMPVLTDDQLFYIVGHKGQPRSVMAKAINLPKLQLNFILERLGRG